jgi:hypothetical protein
MITSYLIFQGEFIMFGIVMIRLMQGTFLFAPIFSYIRYQEIFGTFILSVLGIIITQHIYKYIKQK